MVVFKFGGLAQNQVQQKLNSEVAPCSVLHHHKHCMHDYQGVLLSSRLRYLNKAMSWQIYKNYNRQCASIDIYT